MKVIFHFELPPKSLFKPVWYPKPQNALSDKEQKCLHLQNSCKRELQHECGYFAIKWPHGRPAKRKTVSNFVPTERRRKPRKKELDVVFQPLLAPFGWREVSCSFFSPSALFSVVATRAVNYLSCRIHLNSSTYFNEQHFQPSMLYCLIIWDI